MYKKRRNPTRKYYIVFLILFLLFLLGGWLFFFKQTQASIPTDGLVGYWKFDETSAGSFTDSSGNGYTGTGAGASGDNNTPQPSADIVSQFSYSNVRSLNFDVTDDYVDVGSDSALNPSDALTVTAWIKPTSTAPVLGSIVTRNRSSGTRAYEFYLRDDGTDFRAEGFYNGGAVSLVPSTYDLNINEWVHVAFTMGTSSSALYYNGSSVVTGASVTMNTVSDQTMIGGRDDTSFSFGGFIDDVRLYDRALSSTEISALAVDTPFPVISNVSSSNTGTAATITWTTNKVSSSRVEYGFTDSYGTETTEADTDPRVTSHSVTLTGLSKCRTYHFRVKSTDASDNQTVSVDNNFFTTGCEDVYSGLDASCDDTNPNSIIRVRTDADVTSVRNAVIADIWSGDGLPSGLPNTVTTSIAVPSYITTTNMTNLASIDQYDMNLDEGFTATIYHLHPTVDNNRLLIFVQGHSPDLDQNGGQETMEYFIERGYSILGVHMPMLGPNGGPVAGTGTTAHNNMVSLESATFNPMEIFLEQITIALNYIDANYSYQDITMTGISGGGWTTTLYPAIDTRVSKSFPVAGSYPRYLIGTPCGTTGEGGDYEQSKVNKPENLYSNIASYLDFYILSSVGSGRKQVQILNQNDSCCFSGIRFNVYETTIANEVASLSGGAFDVELDTTHSSHTISSWQHTMVMLPELVQTVTQSESGGSTSVIESSSPTDTYTLVLDGKPTADVGISLASSDTVNGVTVNPSLLTYTRDNWDTAQTVTVTAVDDGLSEGSHTATVSHTASSSDEHYSGITIGDITVALSDVPVDTTAPTISNVSASVTGDTTATVTWATDEASSTQIDYGTTTSYGTTTTETDTAPRVTSHSVSLSNLTCGTLYHYRVRSTDANSNIATGTDNTFTTNDCTADDDSGSVDSGSSGSSGALSMQSTSSSDEGTENTDNTPNQLDQSNVEQTNLNSQSTQDVHQNTQGVTDDQTDQGEAQQTDLNIEEATDSDQEGQEQTQQSDTQDTSLSSNTIAQTTRSFLRDTMSRVSDIFTRAPKLPEHLRDHVYERVTVRLVDNQLRPLVGATVTLFSEPKTKVTDETGTAVFENVEAGEHRMKIIYNNQKASEKLFLDEDVDTLQINTQAEFRDGIAPVWLVLGLIIAVLLGFGLARRFRRSVE